MAKNEEKYWHFIHLGAAKGHPKCLYFLHVQKAGYHGEVYSTLIYFSLDLRPIVQIILHYTIRTLLNSLSYCTLHYSTLLSILLSSPLLNRNSLDLLYSTLLYSVHLLLSSPVVNGNSTLRYFTLLYFYSRSTLSNSTLSSIL